MSKYQPGKYISPLLVLANEIEKSMSCQDKAGDEREKCLEDANEITNREYKSRIPQCQDVVWHKEGFVKAGDIKPVSTVGEALKKRLGTDCILFATPDLSEQKQVTSLGLKERIMAVCVDPDKVYVSEDVDTPAHSHFHDKDPVKYYMSKLVTLREYRERKLQYELPEVIIPGVISRDNIIGGVDIIDDDYYPLRCTCEK